MKFNSNNKKNTIIILLAISFVICFSNYSFSEKINFENFSSSIIIDKKDGWMITDSYSNGNYVSNGGLIFNAKNIKKNYVITYQVYPINSLGITTHDNKMSYSSMNNYSSKSYLNNISKGNFILNSGFTETDNILFHYINYFGKYKNYQIYGLSKTFFGKRYIHILNTVIFDTIETIGEDRIEISKVLNSFELKDGVTQLTR